MNYQVAVSQFQRIFERECFNNKLEYKQFEIPEVIAELSISQADIGNTNKLVEKKETVDLIAGQYEYVIGSGASNIVSDILEIKSVQNNFNLGNLANNNTIVNTNCYPYPYPDVNLKLYSLEQIRNQIRYSGLPTGYSIYLNNDSRILIINSNPLAFDHFNNSAYRLLVNYYMRLEVYNGITSATNNTTWSDLDYTNAVTYGGEFKLPVEYHQLIVDGALANIFPNRMESYLYKLKETLKTKPIVVNPNLIGSFGL